VGSIRLTEFAVGVPEVTEGGLNPRTRIGTEYVYKDVLLDIKVGNLIGNFPANKNDNNTDIADIRDLQAIIQSVTNIFNTVPGQKLLNPYLGLDLTKFVFDPITIQTGDLIARSILKGLGEQEPRIKVSKMHIAGDVANHQYNIQFILEFPNFHDQNITLNGILTKDGLSIAN
tara:strand:+ start:629 stop:1147 length:519 start_codon:yes stop_codon:yes gene_type:complete